MYLYRSNLDRDCLVMSYLHAGKRKDNLNLEYYFLKNPARSTTTKVMVMMVNYDTRSRDKLHFGTIKFDSNNSKNSAEVQIHPSVMHEQRNSPERTPRKPDSITTYLGLLYRQLAEIRILIYIHNSVCVQGLPGRTGRSAIIK